MAGRALLMAGSEAIAATMVAAGCRFFAGYPMTPFTEVLEAMARRLPPAGGTCVNAESELEAIGMCWGAAATGTPAATGSTGQGLALMQESLAEMTLARLPLVVLNMARGQGDYFQSTRGGGHGDYRLPVLAPLDVVEAVAHVTQAFAWAEQWRTPVLVLGDYYLAHTHRSVALPEPAFPARPPWAVGGRTGGTGQATLVSPLGTAKQRDGLGTETGYDLSVHYRACAARTEQMLHGITPRVEAESVEDAEVVVVAYGTPAVYLRAAVRELRRRGLRVGFVRPVTLVPFPYTEIASLTRAARAVAVYENNTGQAVDDVRLAVNGRIPVEFIGGLSTDPSGFGIAPDLDVRLLGERITERFALAVTR
ncbi:thiamine pyrophosphate-binding protein [Streptomyces sp. NPDC006487]|uniref:thiamine pyrophosphate-binding protein n=1 Tax=Streptomyces sp. NPDC006487 TaxID=3364748 RepID=UPI003689225C